MTTEGNKMIMYRGDSESFTVSLEDDNGAVPLQTGDKVYFTIKRSAEETEKILQKIVTTFSNGKAIITIVPNDTSTLIPGWYEYDVQVTFANGSKKTIVKDVFQIDSEVTYE